jgi:beta-lactamase regulating signal transducer with metallopeptidase domain
MPASAQEWSADERRMAMVHELGHVGAGDAAYQVLARFLMALHWINPLAWIACRRLAYQQEAEADRAVLERGLSSSAYAALLLRLTLARIDPPGGNRFNQPTAL